MKLRFTLAALLGLFFTILSPLPSQAANEFFWQSTATYGNDEVIVNYDVAWNNAESGSVTGSVKYNCGGDGSSYKGVVYVEPAVNFASDRAKFKEASCNEKVYFTFAFDPAGAYDIENFEVRAVVGNATSCSAGTSGCPVSTVILTSKASSNRFHDNPYT